MIAHFILTATGSDLPDVEERLCEAVTRNHGHAIETSISHMAGHFTGMMLFNIASQHTPSLITTLKSMEKTGIHTEIEAYEGIKTEGNPVDINVIADNSPQLLAEISRILTEKNAHLSAIHTDVLSAPFTGEPLQRIQAKLRYPSDLNLDAIKLSLELISPELVVELSRPTKDKPMPQRHPA